MKKTSLVFILLLAIAAPGCTVGKIEALAITRKPVYNADYDAFSARVGGAFKGEQGMTHLILLRDEERKTIFTSRTTFRSVDLLEIRVLNGKIAAADFWRVTDGVSEHFVLNDGNIEIDDSSGIVRGKLQGEFTLKEGRPEPRPETTLILRCWFNLPQCEPLNFRTIKADIEKVLAGEKKELDPGTADTPAEEGPGDDTEETKP